MSPFTSLSFYHYDVYSFTNKKVSGKEFKAGDIQAYFQTAINYQYLPDLQFSLGYIYQRSNPFDEETFQNENRLFEQVTLLKGVVSHRFRFEERFIEERMEDKIDFRTRLRYQIGAKIPLEGLILDAGENYLNMYNEFYFSSTGKRNALWSDDWIYLGIGHKTKEWGSFEAGPLVQWSRINEEKDTRTHYTLQVGWTLSF